VKHKKARRETVAAIPSLPTVRDRDFAGIWGYLQRVSDDTINKLVIKVFSEEESNLLNQLVSLLILRSQASTDNTA